MRFRSPLVRCVAGLLVVSNAGCSRQPGGPDGPDEIEPGTAGEALAGACCITDVQTDPRTYHFDSPRWVLDAAEGVGPRVLGVTIAGLASPLVSTTVSRHPSGAAVSSAVGYSLTDFYFIQASGAHTLGSGYRRRLEAYVSYARSTWVVREAGCGAVLGAGVSFKPIGVYFQVRDAASLAIDGTSVIGVFPDCSGGQCGYAPEPVPDAPPPAEDAGTGDGGDR
jgi:hypothetical protein